MAKRWQGNSGLVSRMEERAPPPRGPLPAPGYGPPPGPPGYAPPPGTPPGYAPPPGPPRRPAPPGGFPPPRGPLGRLTGLLPGLRAPLETEDLLVLLILYLLYRESGDTEWLVALAAMLFGE